VSKAPSVGVCYSLQLMHVEMYNNATALMHQRNVGAVIFKLSLNFRFYG